MVPRPGALRDHEQHSFDVAAKNFSSNSTHRHVFYFTSKRLEEASASQPL